MSNDVFSGSIALDFREKDGEYEVEVEYWDSEGNQGSCAERGNSLNDCMTKVYPALVQSMLDNVEEEEEDCVECAGDLQEEIARLREENEKLQTRINNLLTKFDNIDSKYQNYAVMDVKSNTDGEIEKMMNMFKKLGFHF